MWPQKLAVNDSRILFTHIHNCLCLVMVLLTSRMGVVLKFLKFVLKCPEIGVRSWNLYIYPEIFRVFSIFLKTHIILYVTWHKTWCMILNGVLYLLCYLLGFISFITWFYTEKVESICRETQNLVSGSYCIFALVRDHYFNVNTSFWCPEKCPEISNFFCPENKNFVCPGLWLVLIRPQVLGLKVCGIQMLVLFASLFCVCLSICVKLVFLCLLVSELGACLSQTYRWTNHVMWLIMMDT